jgi:phosphoribosylpyrophosphate synthetase
MAVVDGRGFDGNSRREVLDARLDQPNNEFPVYLIGSVRNRICILVDDSTDKELLMLRLAADLLRHRGALRMVAVCVHGLFVSEQLRALGRAGVERVVCSDTVRMHTLPPQEPATPMPPHILPSQEMNNGPLTPIRSKVATDVNETMGSPRTPTSNDNDDDDEENECVVEELSSAPLFAEAIREIIGEEEDDGGVEQ